MRVAFFFFALLLLSSACTDVIEVETPNSERSIAVEGSITNNGCTVLLSTTAGYFDQGQTPVVADARIELYQDGQLLGELNRDTLNPGRYTTGFSGSVGREYYIRIFIPANSSSGLEEGIWRSTPERMNRIFSIDSLRIDTLNRTTFPQVFEKGPYALAYFTEPEGKGDHYRWKEAKNDTPTVQSLFRFDDEFVDGGSFGAPGSRLPAFNFYGPDIEYGDKVSVTFFSISRAYDEYLALVAEQSFQVGGPFAAPPAAVVGNIYREDRPERFGFGYFAASALTRSEIFYLP